MVGDRWVGCLVAAVVGLLAPLVLTPDTTGVALVVLAAALVALAGQRVRATSYAGAAAATGAPDEALLPTPTSRVGDPVRHPLRPRAPGRI